MAGSRSYAGTREDGRWRSMVGELSEAEQEDADLEKAERKRLKRASGVEAIVQKAVIEHEMKYHGRDGRDGVDPEVGDADEEE